MISTGEVKALRKLSDINLTEYPDISKDELKDLQVTYGDLHGNVLSLFYLGIRLGYLKLPGEDLEKQKQCYQEIVNIYKELNSKNAEAKEGKAEGAEAKGEKATTPKAMLARFEEILKQCEMNKIFLRLLGDILADRGGNKKPAGRLTRLSETSYGNDLLMLLFLERFPAEVILSNHDMEALAAFEQPDPIQYILETKVLKTAEKSTLYHLAKLVHEGAFGQERLMKLIEKTYKPAIKAIGYTYDAKSQKLKLFMHAPVGLETVQGLAELYGITYNNKDAKCLMQTIDQINYRVALDIRCNQLNRRMNEKVLTDKVGQDNLPINPLYRLMNHRARETEGNAASIVIKPLDDGTNIQVEHGHDSPYAENLPNMTCLDSNSGKTDLTGNVDSRQADSEIKISSGIRDYTLSQGTMAPELKFDQSKLELFEAIRKLSAQDNEETTSKEYICTRNVLLDAILTHEKDFSEEDRGKVTSFINFIYALINNKNIDELSAAYDDAISTLPNSLHTAGNRFKSHFLGAHRSARIIFHLQKISQDESKGESKGEAESEASNAFLKYLGKTISKLMSSQIDFKGLNDKQLKAVETYVIQLEKILVNPQNIQQIDLEDLSNIVPPKLNVLMAKFYDTATYVGYASTIEVKLDLSAGQWDSAKIKLLKVAHESKDQNIIEKVEKIIRLNRIDPVDMPRLILAMETIADYIQDEKYASGYDLVMQMIDLDKLFTGEDEKSKEESWVASLKTVIEDYHHHIIITPQVKKVTQPSSNQSYEKKGKEGKVEQQVKPKVESSLEEKFRHAQLELLKELARNQDDKDKKAIFDKVQKFFLETKTISKENLRNLKNAREYLKNPENVPYFVAEMKDIHDTQDLNCYLDAKFKEFKGLNFQTILWDNDGKLIEKRKNKLFALNCEQAGLQDRAALVKLFRIYQQWLKEPHKVRNEHFDEALNIKFIDKKFRAAVDALTTEIYLRVTTHNLNAALLDLKQTYNSQEIGSSDLKEPAIAVFNAVLEAKKRNDIDVREMPLVTHLVKCTTRVCKNNSEKNRERFAKTFQAVEKTPLGRKRSWKQIAAAAGGFFCVAVGVAAFVLAIGLAVASHGILSPVSVMLGKEASILISFGVGVLSTVVSGYVYDIEERYQKKNIDVAARMFKAALGKSSANDDVVSGQGKKHKK